MILPTINDFVDILASGGTVLIGEEHYKINCISLPPAHEVPDGFSIAKVLFKDGTEISLKERITRCKK